MKRYNGEPLIMEYMTPSIYQKIINALQKVRTPYFLLADDDDFYNFENIQKCVDKLESDKKIVTCGGQISHFKILDGDLNGKKVLFNLSFKENFCNTSIMKNIQQYLSQPKGIYYFIHRLQDYKKAWLICKRHKLSPRMIELFMELYLFTCGKVEILPDTFYYRQYDHSNNNTANLTNDFLDEIIRFNWHKDINIILDIISKRIAKLEKNNYKVIKEELISYYKDFLTPFVINNLKVDGSSNLAKLARNNMIKKGFKAGKLKTYFKFLRIIKSYINNVINNKNNSIIKSEFIEEFLRNYKN